MIVTVLLVVAVIVECWFIWLLLERVHQTAKLLCNVRDVLEEGYLDDREEFLVMIQNRGLTFNQWRRDPYAYFASWYPLGLPRQN